MDYITIINLILSPIFMLLQAFDFYSTWRILRGGGKELNPIMAWVFNAIGVVKGLIATKASIGAITLYVMYYFKDSLAVTIGLTISNIIYFFLVYLHNMKELKKIGI